jgi:hypothetical protein
VTSDPVNWQGAAPAADPHDDYLHAIALQAFVHTFPLYEMMRMRAATAPRRNGAGRFADTDPATTRRWVNTFIHARKLLGAGASRVVTPNNDTLYSNAWLDLSRGPLVIHVPDTADRYYVLGFLDAWTNPFAHLGRRTTGTGEQLFLVTGPGAHDVAAPAGMTHVRSPTADVWIIGRIMVEGPEDVPVVNALQDGFWMKSLDAWRRGAPFDGEVVDTGVDPAAPLDADSYLAIVNRALAGAPMPPDEAGLQAAFAKVGIRADDGSAGPGATPAQRRAMQRALTAGPDMLRNAAPGRVQGGWSAPIPIGDSFGDDWWQRAVVALKYIGVLTSAEAIYPMADVDAAGRMLTGAHRYMIRFAAGGEPPVDSFWSLTIYDAATRMLVPNPLDRYRIGGRSRGLVRDADGSLTLTLQRESPGREREPNWLPAPAGRFYLCLRAYQPRAEMLDGRYRLPDIVRVD